MTEPHIDWPTELQNESRREPENPGVGLLQILPSRAGSYDAGSALPAGYLPMTSMEQVQRGLDRLRDHYRDGTFRCPSDRGVVYVNDSPLEGAACEHDTFSHVGPCPDSPPVVIDGEDDPPDYDG